MDKNKAIIVSVVIVLVTIIAAFYILNSKKTISPVSSNTNQTLVASERQPSKTLKKYSDDAGFTFQYPNDVQISKIEIENSITYSNLEFTSNQIKGLPANADAQASGRRGKILIKIEDTKLESVDDWFTKQALKGNIKEIKIGGISGGELQMDNKILAAAINQSILFTIEVETQNQKYWQSVYETILTSFNFVSEKENTLTEAQSLDNLGDAVLEEEIVE